MPTVVPCEMQSSGKAIELCRRDDGLEIAHVVLEAHALDVPVRQARAALVVAHERPIPRQRFDEVAPDRALQVELEVCQPVADLDQRRPAAAERVREPHAIVRGAEADLLPYGHAGFPREALMLRLRRSRK